MRIAVVSDTHMPRGARALPEGCEERLRAADLILHAGDLTGLAFLEWLCGLGRPVEAVVGNMDEPELHALLPETRVVEDLEKLGFGAAWYLAWHRRRTRRRSR